MYYIFFLFALLFVSGSSVELPRFIPKCNLSQFDKCAADATNNILPILLRGENQLGIPSYFPLRLNDEIINTEDLRLKLSNCELHGFENIHLYHAKFVPPKADMGFLMNKVSFTGEFNPGGSFFEAKFPTAGKVNFTLTSVDLKMEVLYKITKNELSEDMYSPYKVHVDIDADSAVFTFSDYWTGTTYLHVENSDRLLSHILPIFKKSFKTSFVAMITPFTNNFSLQELLANEN